MDATPCLKKSQLNALSNGLFTATVKGGQVLSVQPDGSLQTRPAGTSGPWESGALSGNIWRVSDSAYPTGSYALLVDLNA